jgi:hypothetical protein
VRIALIADIRGNVLALKAVLGDLEHLGVGDCVSGPLWPRETAELLIRRGWPTIRCDQDRWVSDWPPAKQYPSDAFACRALRRSESTGSPHDAYSARLVTFREPWPSVTDYSNPGTTAHRAKGLPVSETCVGGVGSS